MNSRKRDKVQTQPPNSSSQAGGKVAMLELIGDKLRAFYNEVASEPVPDRFAELLKELEAKSHQKKPE